MSKVISISREFGSGGREIGYHLSELLGIPVYDKEIISMAAEDSNMAEDVFHAHDEVISRGDHKDDYKSINPFSPLYEIPVSDQVFLLQSQIIRKLEQQGPCIIIGRCSDIIVDEGLDVFICSSLKNRVARLLAIEPDGTAKKMEARIREIDRKRREYYQYYSGNEWGNPRNYDISLNSGRLGISRCVEIIADIWQKGSQP